MCIQPLVTHDAHNLCSRPFLASNPTERQLWYLYDKFGASLRYLNGFAKRPKAYESLLLTEICKLKSTEIKGVFENPESYQLSHLIITLHPSPEDRTRYLVAPASPYVFELLLDKHLLSQIDHLEDLYDLLQASPVGASAAGLIFEHRMHAVLRQKQELLLYPRPL